MLTTFLSLQPKQAPLCRNVSVVRAFVRKRVDEAKDPVNACYIITARLIPEDPLLHAASSFTPVNTYRSLLSCFSRCAQAGSVWFDGLPARAP